MTNKGLVIVTGGSRGIGAAICQRLAAEGHPIAVNYTANRGRADQVVASIEAAGGRAVPIQGDVAIEEDVIRLFAQAQSALGTLYGLVNNAGIIGTSGRLHDLEASDLARLLAINVAGSILCARQAVRTLSTRHGGQGGAIVNMSSAAARIGGAGEFVHYATTKGAIDTFTIGLAREVAEEGIRVNAVAPGLVDTEMNTAERKARLAPTVPMKRAGTPNEIAEAVAWLLNPNASYVTGTILTVSGGR